MGLPVTFSFAQGNAGEKGPAKVTYFNYFYFLVKII